MNFDDCYWKKRLENKEKIEKFGQKEKMILTVLPKKWKAWPTHNKPNGIWITLSLLIQWKEEITRVV